MGEPCEEQTDPEYRIEFERTGGFAGMHMSAVIDSARLSPEEARNLEENLAVSGLYSQPAKLSSTTGGADRFHYRITVERAGQKHTVEFGESAAPETFQPLIRQLTLLARQGNRE